jgi:hypothetical protein
VVEDEAEVQGLSDAQNLIYFIKNRRESRGRSNFVDTEEGKNINNKTCNHLCASANLKH